jgi:hypothetical protein
MKLFLGTALLSIGTMMVDAAAISQTAAGDRLLNCTARVLYSEELPFAPEGKWLVNVTLEIKPPSGDAYAITLHDWMAWQNPPPRRGQTFRLLCDPSHPGNLQLVSGPRI